MKGTLLALALACLGAALTLEDRQWVLDRPWLLVVFWAGAAVFGALWLAMMVRNRKHPHRPNPHLETGGNLSPNIIASEGSTVHYNAAPQPQASDQRRPYVRPVDYTRVSEAEVIYSGYKEFLRVSNDGDSAYDLRVETLRVGQWNVEFAPLNYLKGLDRIFVSKISKTTYVDGFPHSEIAQRLEVVWHEALRTQPFEKLELAIHYRDYKHNAFLSVCSIEIDRHPNGMIFFRLGDFGDSPVVPTRGSGLYAT